MERLMHETRETFSALLVVCCLVAGVLGAVFYTVGPEGWLISMFRELLLDPNMRTMAALIAVICAVAALKHWLDSRPQSSLNNLLVGVVALGGFAFILQGIRSILG